MQSIRTRIAGKVFEYQPADMQTSSGQLVPSFVTDAINTLPYENLNITAPNGVTLVAC